MPIIPIIIMTKGIAMTQTGFHNHNHNHDPPSLVNNATAKALIRKNSMNDIIFKIKKDVANITLEEKM